MKKSNRKKSVLLRIIILLLLFTAITVVIDLMRISKYEIIPMRPSEGIRGEHDQVYYELVNGATEIDWERLNGTLKYIQGEYDCSDFRLVNLIRIIYEYGDRIPDPGCPVCRSGDCRRRGQLTSKPGGYYSFTGKGGTAPVFFLHNRPQSGYTSVHHGTLKPESIHLSKLTKHSGQIVTEA